MGLKKLFLFLMLCFVAVGVHAQTQPLQPINVRYLGTGAGGGTADAQTVTYTPATVAYTSFQVVSWIPTHANATTTPTLNVDGVGPKTIIRAGGSALAASDLTTTAIAIAWYDGTAFELMDPQTASFGAVTATSLLASGIVDGTAPVTITTGTSASLGGTYKSGYTFNQEATAGQAVTYTLPTAAAGLQYCVANSNGGAANTGTLELATSASGQYIIFTDGTLSASGGYVISGGAARDSACAVGVDSTHWLLYVSSGTWTKH